MNIKGATALVTGANRGLGAAFVRGLLTEGATKVYGAARSDYDPEQDGVVPVRLDIIDDAAVAAAAAQLTDVDIVINNAGVFHPATALDDHVEDALRTDLETNVFGTLRVSRAFAPILAANGGGALVNVLSVASWRVRPTFAGYAASKSAEWSITNSLRLAMRPNGTLVVGVHAGLIDTDMAAALPGAKAAPDEIVALVLAAVRDGEEEVLVDDRSRESKALLSQPLTAMYPVE
jgi:NAD(P)-dependent dehydrogenase (short-subunit alcohol dehydrogenase family)